MKKLIIGILILALIGVGCVYTFKIDVYKYFETENNTNTKKKVVKVQDSDIKNSIFKDCYNKAVDTVSNMTIEEKIGQLFLVRYDRNSTDKFKEYYPGGYILFAKDFENQTKESMKTELSNLQKNNKYKLILGVDEEGGYVTRVSRYPAFRESSFLSPRNYFDQGDLPLLEQMENEKATLLKSIGLNLNLAPVADVSVNKDDFIYNRAFGYDANKTSEYIKYMVRYANNNKINSTLKHFPGYGNNKDTHTGIAIDERDYQTFVNYDYLPFKAGIKENVPSVLVSHNIVKCMDEKYPASLSNKVIGELRNKLNFTGIVMTDDLAMDAVKKYVEDGNAATLAINAGNDMIITSDFIDMREEVLKSYNENKISEETINKAVLRVIAWKYYTGLF